MLRNSSFRVLTYLEAVLARPSGHPLGVGKMSSGAFQMFRDQNPDVNCFSQPEAVDTTRIRRLLAKHSRYSALPSCPHCVACGMSFGAMAL